jgi:hypothetical protein
VCRLVSADVADDQVAEHRNPRRGGLSRQRTGHHDLGLDRLQRAVAVAADENKRPSSHGDRRLKNVPQPEESCTELASGHYVELVEDGEDFVNSANGEIEAFCVD